MRIGGGEEEKKKNRRAEGMEMKKGGREGVGRLGDFKSILETKLKAEFMKELEGLTANQ